MNVHKNARLTPIGRGRMSLRWLEMTKWRASPSHHARQDNLLRSSGLTTAGIVSSQGLQKNRGDQEVMRRARLDPKARGLVCAVKRANPTSGPAGRQNPHRQAEDMTAPTIKRNTAK
jgi:hypothetical protein